MELDLDKLCAIYGVEKNDVLAMSDVFDAAKRLLEIERVAYLQRLDRVDEFLGRD